MFRCTVLLQDLGAGDRLKVLYYNWVDYLDEEGRGGGVTVYQRNVMRAIRAEAETVFLCSGLSYDLRPRPVRWEEVRTGPDEDRGKRFEIINSGTQAPAHHSFGDMSQVDHDETRDVFFDFIESTGPYDVVHFNNLEGLPASVLTLKERWPDTKVIVTLHNYYPICPQVNLWFQERENCGDFDQGRNCTVCLVDKRNPKTLRFSGAVAYRLKQVGIGPGSWIYDRGYRIALRQVAMLGRAAMGVVMLGRRRPVEVTQQDARDRGVAYAQRRARMIDLINTCCDRVLCASEAVRDVASGFGIEPALMHVSYIGTSHVQAWNRTEPKQGVLDAAGTLTICFLGYMRRDKGFYFLLETLEAVPDEMAAKMKIVIAARQGDDDTMGRIAALSGRFADVVHVDGYTHDGLDDILHDVNVGIIPVLWHDNLPQVAIEMHARHLPLITSDLGGAKELGNSRQMTFPAGDQGALIAIFDDLLTGGFDADTYWPGAMAPLGVERHIAELKSHYAGEPT